LPLRFIWCAIYLKIATKIEESTAQTNFILTLFGILPIFWIYNQFYLILQLKFHSNLSIFARCTAIFWNLVSFIFFKNKSYFFDMFRYQENFIADISQKSNQDRIGLSLLVTLFIARESKSSAFVILRVPRK
jgi:hypothetical protein